MNEITLNILVILAALGCGLVGGIFFAFSTFIMKALKRLLPYQGIESMQAINIAVINIWFIAAFFGTALVCLVLVISSLLNSGDGSLFLISGGIIYLIGTILITIAANVPKNNKLEKVDSKSVEGSALWTDYLKTWTFWNHVRTIAALTASILFILY